MAKTENKSIRFNHEHLKFALDATGLKKEQELIDKLLSDFYAAKNPLQNLFAGSSSIIGIGFQNGELKTSNENVISFLDGNAQNKKKFVKSYEYFQKQLLTPFDFPQEHIDFIKEVNESDLSGKQKNDLILASKVKQS